MTHANPRALAAITELANADDPKAALAALHAASDALGEDASAFAPLLETLLGRICEVHQLRQLAGHDELTGVANRRTFRDALEREAVRHERTSCGFAVILLDLDDLKLLNDAYGHATGDEALHAVADACTRSLRGSDLVARLGGDEFAVLVIEANAEIAQTVARRLRRAIETRIVAGRRLAISIGVAASGNACVSAEELMSAADDNLYADKCARKGISRATPVPEASRPSVVRVRGESVHIGPVHRAASGG